MRILSHRGYWKAPDERNTILALERSFSLGFGTETDLRDLGGKLVVSHDPPRQDALPAEALFDLHRAHDPTLPLALNIKADGLQDALCALLDHYRPEGAFVFDMSIPDTRQWLARQVPTFARQSELETSPALYSNCDGIWLDAFETEWWTEDILRSHLEAGKRVCIVSPELHGRPHLPLWTELESFQTIHSERLMLCTDLPEAARSHFGHDH